MQMMLVVVGGFAAVVIVVVVVVVVVVAAIAVCGRRNFRSCTNLGCHRASGPSNQVRRTIAVTTANIVHGSSAGSRSSASSSSGS